MADIRHILSTNFRYYRKQKSLSQEEFADKLKIKRSTYALKEKNGDFTQEEIAKAEKLFGIPKNMLEKDHGHGPKNVKIDDLGATLLQNQVEIIASQRTILSVLSEMNAPGLKTSSKALSDIYRKMVKDEAEQVAGELSKKE